jgi:hypothetical protein
LAENLGFNIYDADGAILAAGVLTVDASYNVTAISGTADGVVIGGLSNFANPDNHLDPVGIYGPAPGIGFNVYGVDNSGLSFSAGDVNYNLAGSAAQQPQFSNPGQSGDTLTSSSGATRTVRLTILERRPDGICFLSGTRLLTTDGHIAVESLQVGQYVPTPNGPRPIVWIGKRELDCRDSGFQDLPVRIAAHAFGENRPARDLYLSPQHAVAVTCLEEVLIPIKYLINGGTIAQESRERVEYWHVELDEHDLVLAENLPAESFLDTQGRVGFFDNAEHAAAHPNLPLKGLDDFCRPLVLDGPIITAVRAQLIARMQKQGWSVSEDADLHVLADGVRIEPNMQNEIARFIVPADARELRIRSRRFTPQQFYAKSGDGRWLGVALRSVSIVNGPAVARTVAIDDAALQDGFSFVQGQGDMRWRWTTGDAVLPRNLWADCQGAFFLRLELASERFRAWQAPSSAAGRSLQENSPRRENTVA